MSALAKLLQISANPKPQTSGLPAVLKKAWTRVVQVARSTRIQRRVRRLELVERVAINNKQSVALFRMDKREFVVGCCADSVVLLVPPASEAVKTKVAKPRRKSNTSKSKTRKAVASAPIHAVAEKTVKLSTNIALDIEENSASIQIPNKVSAPSKAQLLKSFRRLS